MRAPPHQPPAANPGAVLGRIPVIQVIEIGQPKTVAELVCHAADGLAEVALALNRTVRNRAIDVYGRTGQCAVGRFVQGEAQISYACSRPLKKTARCGEGVDEDVVNHTVIVA